MPRDFTNSLEEFENNGLVVIKNVLSATILDKLREELNNAIYEDEIARPDVFDKGMVHNCMFRGTEMAKVLDCPEMNIFVGKILMPTFIIYAYQSSSLNPSSSNYGSRMHVDSPRYIEEYPTNVGVIFPLDDFTLDNGATYYLPASHKNKTLPSEEEFYENAKRGICNAGDMLVFAGRLAHAAGQNKTTRTRHALTINFCRSYMRQRFDFPRMMSESDKTSFSENTKKLLGWNVRMPTHLDEFYLPEDQRLYKPNQG